MNQQVRQLTVTRQRAPEVPTEARAESSYTQILSAVRKWDARAYGAQLAGSAAEHLRHIRLPKWQLPHARRPRLSWHKPALERLHQELLLFQAQWPSWSRGKLLLNVAAVSVVLVLAIMAAIARHQSTILPVADSSSGNTTPVPAQPLSAVDQQIVAPPPLKHNGSASARDAGAPTASFKRVWAGKDEVDYISDDVTIRHFRPLPTPKKSSAWNKQVNIGKDVTVRYFNSPRLPTAEPSGQQASEQAVKD
jgi:hypothetical protein